MTERKRAFVDAYISDIKHNATAAAIKAGYSAKSAKQIAYKLMHDEEVKKAIAAEIKERHAQNTAEANEVVEFLTSVMRGEKVDNIPLFVGDGCQELEEGKPSARDRLKAAELLGKHYALFTDKAQIDSEGVVQIINDIPRGDTDAEAD